MSRETIDQDRISRLIDLPGVMFSEELLPVVAGRLDVGVDAHQSRRADGEIVRSQIGLHHGIHAVAVRQIAIRDAVEARIGGAEVDQIERLGAMLRPFAEALEILPPIKIRIDQFLVAVARSARDQIHIGEMLFPLDAGGERVEYANGGGEKAAASRGTPKRAGDDIEKWIDRKDMPVADIEIR